MDGDEPLTTRYPFSELAAAMRLSEHQSALALGLSGSTEQDYRRRGLTERVADRLSVKAGLHPSFVWADWLAGLEVVCASGDCTRRFVPRPLAGRPHVYCSPRCRRREHKRRHRMRPDVREVEAARQRAYYASLSPAADAARLVKRRTAYAEKNRRAS